MVLAFLVCAMFWSFAFILFFCGFGQRVTDAFDEIHYTITQFEWFAFPLKTQKLLPVMMIATKQHVFIQVFGSKSCVRETFKEVSPAFYHKHYTLCMIVNWTKCWIALLFLPFSGGQWWIFILHNASTIWKLKCVHGVPWLHSHCAWFSGILQIFSLK